MSAKALELYLRKYVSQGKIDHALRACINEKGNVAFYIHPVATTGDTLDIEIDEAGHMFASAPITTEPPDVKVNVANLQMCLEELVGRVKEHIEAKNRFSISGIQREFRIGFVTAMKVTDQLADEGIIGRENVLSPWEILKKPTGEG